MLLKTLKGFTIVEVVLAVSIGIVIVIASIRGYTGYINDVKYQKTKMILNTVRTNLKLYQYRKSGIPNDGDLNINNGAGRPFYGDSTGNFPLDPITENNIVPKVKAGVGPDACPPTSIGGWWYNNATGQFGINICDTEYGTAGTKFAYQENPSTW